MCVVGEEGDTERTTTPHDDDDETRPFFFSPSAVQHLVGWVESYTLISCTFCVRVQITFYSPTCRLSVTGLGHISTSV